MLELCSEWIYVKKRVVSFSPWQVDADHYGGGCQVEFV